MTSFSERDAAGRGVDGVGAGFASGRLESGLIAAGAEATADFFVSDTGDTWLVFTALLALGIGLTAETA